MVAAAELLQDVGNEWADDGDGVLDVTARAGGVDDEGSGRLARSDADQPARQAGQRRLGQPVGADLRLDPLHAGGQERRRALGGEVARGDAGAPGGQDHPRALGDGRLNGLTDAGFLATNDC